LATFKEIEAFFLDYKFEKGVFKLNKFPTFNDPKKLVDTHISYLKANSGNRVYLTYYERLKQLYLKLKKEDAEI